MIHGSIFYAENLSDSFLISGVARVDYIVVALVVLVRVVGRESRPEHYEVRVAQFVENVIEREIKALDYSSDDCPDAVVSLSTFVGLRRFTLCLLYTSSEPTRPY